MIDDSQELMKILKQGHIKECDFSIALMNLPKKEENMVIARIHKENPGLKAMHDHVIKDIEKVALMDEGTARDLEVSRCEADYTAYTDARFQAVRESNWGREFLYTITVGDSHVCGYDVKFGGDKILSEKTLKDRGLENLFLF